MTRNRHWIAALVVACCVDVRANTPPPAVPVEAQICSATHVFVGTASNVRFVNATRISMCATQPPAANGALTSCGSAEVDIAVSEVLFPAGWSPDNGVVYRFGGGLFSVASLRQDLEGQTYLFHVKVDSAVGGNTFVPSAPWVLGKSPDFVDEAKRILRNCARP